MYNLSNNFVGSSSVMIFSSLQREDAAGGARTPPPPPWLGPLSQDEAAAFGEAGQLNSVCLPPPPPPPPPFLSVSGSWHIVGGANGKAPAPVPLVHHTNVKGTIHVTAVCAVTGPPCHSPTLPELMGRPRVGGTDGGKDGAATLLH